MPYRIDVRCPDDAALSRLVDLGALDVELSPDGLLSALVPDSLPPEQVAVIVGVEEISVSPAVGRDAGSVWILNPQPIHAGRLRITPADGPSETGALKLLDSAAFGTGLHPTTALCLEMLDETLRSAVPDAVLDVGTGSGVIALAALVLGVPRALGIDLDDYALGVAAENARINGLHERLQLAREGPVSVAGTWPLVFANIQAAPLVEMAPALVRCVGHHGELVLSGIPSALERESVRAYRHLGMRLVEVKSRAGWMALRLHASW